MRGTLAALPVVLAALAILASGPVIGYQLSADAHAPMQPVALTLRF